MKKKATAFALLFLNLGAFLTTVTFLPRRGSWGYSGPISYFINSRDRWDIAWGVFVAGLALSFGVYLLIQASGAFERRESSGSDEEG